jgi:RES domain-containing protein
MIVYRLCKALYQNDLSGKGAELYGGRWNNKGTALVYTSQSRALAFAELSMHLPLGIVPKDYVLVTIDIPDSEKILELPNDQIPADWRSNPHSDSTQQLGDQFARSLQGLVMRVPSAIVPGDYNYLLNPAHSMIKNVRIVSVEPFEFDSRFASRGV